MQKKSHSAFPVSKTTLPDGVCDAGLFIKQLRSPNTHSPKASSLHGAGNTTGGLIPCMKIIYPKPSLSGERRKTERLRHNQLRLWARGEADQALALLSAWGHSAPSQHPKLTSFQGPKETPTKYLDSPHLPGKSALGDHYLHQDQLHSHLPPSPICRCLKETPIFYSFYCFCVTRHFYAPGTF